MAATISGNTVAASAWCGRPHDCSGPSIDEEERRDDIFAEIRKASAMGRFEQKRILATPNARIIIEADIVHPAEVVHFDCVWRSDSRREIFWMNRSSVAELLARLDTLPAVPFERIFFNEIA